MRGSGWSRLGVGTGHFGAAGEGYGGGGKAQGGMPGTLMLRDGQREQSSRQRMKQKSEDCTQKPRDWSDSGGGGEAWTGMTCEQRPREVTGEACAACSCF